MFRPEKGEDLIKLKEPLRLPKLRSVKLDGIRGVTTDGDLLSNSLKQIPNRYIRDKLRPYQDLDGEIICGAWNSPDVRRRTSSAVRTVLGEPQFTYFVFDDLSQDLPFEQRLEILQKRELPPFIRVLDQKLVLSMDDLNEAYQAVLDQGGEGLILRNPEAMHKDGRATLSSQDNLKMKPHLDEEGQVSGVYEAMHNTNESFTNELGRTTRSTDAAGLVPSGMIGGFFVRNKAGAMINVGAGKLDHPARRSIWQNPNLVVGKNLTYRHMPVGAKDKPCFARFECWRDDFDLPT